METTAERELTEETRLPLKLVVSLLTGVVLVVAFYFGLQAQIAAANGRIDGLEGQLGRLQKIDCAVAKKVNVEVLECLPNP